jgi:phosphoadenosine phosphosulfate reductase
MSSRADLPCPTALAGCRVDENVHRSAVARLNSGYSSLDLAERLAAIRAATDGKVVFTTSFGFEDQAITHAIFAADIAIDVVTLDTGRLFPETYRVWAETEERYSRRVRAIYPDGAVLEAWNVQFGIDGFRSSVGARHGCCDIRKVEPLGRALGGASVWVTGIRAEQSPERATAPYSEIDAARDLLKVNPLLDWTRTRLLAFISDHQIPCNSLHARGFLSIGCEPCTRAVKPGEPERAGRWWWEQQEKKECGLHNRPAAAAASPILSPSHKE